MVSLTTKTVCCDSRTKHINVTELTPSQKRELFIDHLTQAGFSGFDKKKEGKQTYYIFTYKN